MLLPFYIEPFDFKLDIEMSYFPKDMEVLA